MQSPPALFRVWRGRGATSRASPASRQKSLPSGLSYSDRCYRIALLSNRDDPVKANQMRETEAAARALGMTVQVNWVRAGADCEGAFQSIGRERAEALVFLHPDQVVFVIHPDPAQISPRALEAFVVRLNSRMAAATLTSDLQAFEAHPDGEFCRDAAAVRRSRSLGR